MRDAWIISARADMRVSPKKSLSSEKTRSAAAEFGVKEKTIRAAAAQVGNLLQNLPVCVFQSYMTWVHVVYLRFGPLWSPNLNYLEGIWIDLVSPQT